MIKTEKTEIIKKYARHEGDTGSPDISGICRNLRLK